MTYLVTAGTELKTIPNLIHVFMWTKVGYILSPSFFHLLFFTLVSSPCLFYLAAPRPAICEKSEIKTCAVLIFHFVTVGCSFKKYAKSPFSSCTS